jgi:photosystem II stability/assembly factor-like uncharacterized protein
MLLASALGALGLGVMAGPASAGIWTSIPSGTTDTISAIEYQGPTRFWYATTNGKIGYRQPDGTFAQGAGITPGVIFNDIAFQASGSVGIAVGNGNNVWRSDNGGAGWSKVILPPTTNNDDCSGDPAGGTSSFDIGYAASFASNTVVFVTGNRGNILKSTNAGASFIEVNKKPNDDDGSACRVSATDITDLEFFDATRGVFLSRYFGESFYTDTGLTSNAVERDSTVNNYDAVPRFAWDPANPQRGWSVDRCADCFSSTDTGGITFSRVGIGGPDILPEGAPRAEALHDIAYTSGTMATAGAAGQILTSNDGKNFFYQPADSPNATRDWKAVDLADGANGAVGGADGALVVSAAANSIPDIVKPTGTIAGPTSATAGQPVTFTLNAADTGGSGLNPASYSWTSAGLSTQGGGSVAYTFPSAGFYTVKVTFADNAGNTETATKSITISRPAAGGGGGGGSTPTLPVDFRGPGNKLDAKIVGNRVRVRARGTIKLPAGTPSSACKGKIKLTVKRKRTTLAKRSAKLKRKSGKCRFGKTIFIKRSKVGRTTTRLRLKVAVTGNAALSFAPVTKTLVIKK